MPGQSTPFRGPLNRALLVLVASVGATSAAAALGAPATAAALPSGVAVGLPLYGGSDGGQVDVFGSSGRRTHLSRDDFASLPAVPFPAFGSSVAIGDLDADGDQDVVVGSPGSPGSGTAGEVDIFFRTATGFGSAPVVMTPSSTDGDRVGAAVALTHRESEFGPVADLWVGAPGTDVNGTEDAGTVYHYMIALNGDGVPPTFRLADTITQDTTEVGGVVESGDRFGGVLAPATDGVVVGVPEEDIGIGANIRVNAGAVQRIRVDGATGQLLTGQNVSQASEGMPGAAEAGDRFGASVSDEGFAVGIPGEDVGGFENAGMVQTFRGSSKLRGGLVPTAAFTQNTPGVRGTVEAGDQFGASVAVGIFDCQEVLTVAAGVPGEDIGAKANAGTVELFKLPSSQPPCASRGLHQGHGLPGLAEAGDRTGAALTTRNGDPESEEDRHDTLVIGVPGEDVGAATDTGRALTWQEGFDTIFGYPGDPAGLEYGSVLGTEPS